MKRVASILMLLLLALGACTNRKALLLEDDFSALRRGPLGSGAGAHTEYHYIPAAAPKGNWAISTFRYNLPESWYVRDTPRGRAMVQTAVNTDRHWHPMVVAGDELWTDYQLEITMAASDSLKQYGLAFRYQNDRCYYFFGFRGGKQLLMMVRHGKGFREPREVILAESPCKLEADTPVTLRVNVAGPLLEAGIEGGEVFSVIDTSYRDGKVALLADAPAEYYKIVVSCSRQEERAFQNAVGNRRRIEEKLISANPKMKLWKKASTEGFGVGRNLRFGDLDGDGETDVLIGQVIHHGPKDRNSELSCLTAMTLDGKVLWQTGKPDPWKSELTNDVAFQIHDLDGDGINEVIYCMHQEIIVAEGSSGKVLKRRSTPASPGGKPLASGHNIFPSILGDCLYFCDLEGLGHDANLVIKDRYRYLWAYDSSLKPIWEGECVTGHYPYAYDVDQDGRDELLMGYTLFDDDGTIIWSLDGKVQDHADGVAIAKLMDGEAPRYLCAASDEGLFFADMEGRILKHHYIGHVQNPALANFRDDLPGLETVSINFWANQGIIHLFDAEGNIYMDLEPNQYGSMCLPLNWTGGSEEFFVLNANVDEGGAWDGYGRKVLEFPDDGHPDMCYAVLDITGDCRDEIVVWDPHQLWVYTQDNQLDSGPCYKPVRNPLYNYSNYQATVSLPAWHHE